MTRPVPQVLLPWNPAEAMTVAEAAAFARRQPRTMRIWAAQHDLGRRIGGEWMLSRVALLMLLENNKAALGAYLAGERQHNPAVAEYFRRAGVEFAR